MNRSLPAALALALVLPAAAEAEGRDPIDHSRARAPDGTAICAAWVHDRYRLRVGKRSFATWHPPRDPRFRCAFGHEHGSNPRAWRGYRRSRRPAFERIGAFAGVEEAHAGFKVFVTNDDRRGYGWMIVLHQGSSSPRRGTVRFHSLEAWLVRRAAARRSARVVAHVRRMADFGPAVASCPGASARPSQRLLPTPRCSSVYERWDTELEVGGVLRARPGFAIDNAITQFDPARPAAVIFNKSFACGPHDPGGWDSYCKGDKRTLFHPRWEVRNRGPARFRTDAYGRRTARGLPQFVSDRLRVDQGEDCCGVETAFVMERPSDGGLYRPGRGLSSASFEHPGYCLLRAN